MHPNKKIPSRVRRHGRVRRKVQGTPQRPRLVVFRSLRHIYAQLVDDEASRTVAAASSQDADLKGAVDGGTVAGAAVVGEALARKASGLNVAAAVFDRGGYKYHGRVKALAEGARKGGLSF